MSHTVRSGCLGTSVHFPDASGSGKSFANSQSVRMPVHVTVLLPSSFTLEDNAGRMITFPALTSR